MCLPFSAKSSWHVNSQNALYCHFKDSRYLPTHISNGNFWLFIKKITIWPESSARIDFVSQLNSIIQWQKGKLSSHVFISVATNTVVLLFTDLKNGTRIILRVKIFMSIWKETHLYECSFALLMDSFVAWEVEKNLLTPPPDMAFQRKGMKIVHSLKLH